MARSTQEYVRTLEDSNNILNPLLHLLIQKRAVRPEEGDSAMAAVLKKSFDTIQAQAGTLLLCDADERQPSFSWIYLSPRLHAADPARQRKAEDEAQGALKSAPRDPDHSAAQVFETGESVVQLGQRECMPSLGCHLASFGITAQALVAVPVTVGNRCIGVIEAINRFPAGEHVGAFPEEDLALLEDIAGYCGRLIARVRDPHLPLPERELAGYIARLTKCELATSLEPNVQQIMAIGEEPLKRYLILPLIPQSGKNLRAAMADPMDFQGITAFEVLTGCKITERIVATPAQITEVLAQIFHGGQRPAAPAEESKRGSYKGLPAAIATVEKRGGDDEEEDGNSGPIITLVNRLIEDAHQLGASDIHIEPYEDSVAIRYRIDGICRMKVSLPKEVQPALVARLKIMSDLNIAEHRLPQDGKIVFQNFSPHVNIDLRVSVAPMNYGESVVLRLLDKTQSTLPLDRLGFTGNTLERYRQLIRIPYGMILHCGPTGSGKSMTLYAALNEINSPELKIVTAEDPIEYTLRGINQLQVKREIGLTFASTLRCFLRQDPDIILVGEIRDAETAEIAVEAALTGHLLFSTLHTNDACSAVTRLVEIGIEPYLIANALMGICAQRLIRRLCTCKQPGPPTPEERRMLECAHAAVPESVFRPAGCYKCDNSGYKGRVGIHELLCISEALRLIINQGAPGDSLRAQSKREGMRTLYEDAMEKVGRGVSSFAEALVAARNENSN
jgi:type II secretory ATPase GspE/PulE/Tfp pilus assembly ATPase PilB-like protein